MKQKSKQLKRAKTAVNQKKNKKTKQYPNSPKKTRILTSPNNFERSFYSEERMKENKIKAATIQRNFPKFIFIRLRRYIAINKESLEEQTYLFLKRELNRYKYVSDARLYNLVSHPQFGQSIWNMLKQILVKGKSKILYPALNSKQKEKSQNYPLYECKIIQENSREYLMISNSYQKKIEELVNKIFGN